MSFEVEQKYRLQNPSTLKQKLKGLRAKKIRSGFESNELFDLENVLRGQGSVLRLRRYGKEKNGLLTFKGPKLKGRYKKRVEIETEIDWRAAKKILKAAGFRAVAGYSKTRTEYVLGLVHVTLDHLPGIGWFAEIEGKAARISEFEKKLGLQKKDREERSYLEILSAS